MTLDGEPRQLRRLADGREVVGPVHEAHNEGMEGAVSGGRLVDAGRFGHLFRSPTDVRPVERLHSAEPLPSTSTRRLRMGQTTPTRAGPRGRAECWATQCVGATSGDGAWHAHVPAWGAPRRITPKKAQAIRQVKAEDHA